MLSLGSETEDGPMSFDEWFRGQLPRLVRFATVLCGGPDPAEDILQEVAAKAQRHWPRLGGVAHPEAYLRRMVVNEYISWRRRSQRVIPYPDLDRPASGIVADEHAERAELAAELAKLPPRQRAVVILRYLEDLTDREIAEQLGCRPTTVRSNLARALRTLRISMTATHDPLPEEDVHAAH